MASVATYKIIGVHADGRTRVWSKLVGAPNDAWLCSRGTSYKCGAMVRYMPSRKGWTVTDVRHAQHVIPLNFSYSKWVGYSRSPRIFPTEEAAVMFAIHILQQV